MDTDLDIDEALGTAVAIAREAGELLRDRLDEAKGLERKSSAIDLVTRQDRESERLIVRRLNGAFAGHEVVAEEEHAERRDEGAAVPGAAVPGVGAGAVPRWYVDPLDGTNNYAHGLPVFSVSLALCLGGQTLLGVVHDPMRAETFTAAAGRGAHLSGAEGAGPRRLRVSGTQRLIDALLATGFPYDRHTSERNNLAQFAAFLRRAQGLRRMGSAALDLAWVAAGRLDGFWELKLRAWDVAAGALLVREAGGRATAIDGSALELGAGRLDVLAGNDRLHGAMLGVLAGV